MDIVKFSFVVSVILCGCHESNWQADEHNKNAWIRIPLRSVDGKVADDVWSICVPSFNKCVAAILDERLAEKAESEKVGDSTRGYTTNISLRGYDVLMGSDGALPIVVLASYEDNAAHVYQRNLVLVGVVKGNELLFQEIIECSDYYIMKDDSVVLWSDNRNTEYRLFIGTTGPIFQGWTSLAADAWSIRPGHGNKRLFLAYSQETINHTVEFHFTPKGSGMVGYVRLGAPDPDGKCIEFSSKDKAEEVTVTVIDPVTIAVEISD